MTTNVFDVRAGLLTSDTRWSASDGDWIAYVDNTGYDKIVFDRDLGILFAGNLRVIDIWKSWFANRRLIVPPLNHTLGMSMIAVNMIDGDIEFHSDYLLTSKENDSHLAWYGGTGGTYAKDCWQANKCAIKAVATAISLDNFSGGSTVFVNRLLRNSNASNSETVDIVMDHMKERGIMMNVKGSQEPKLLKDAANDASDAAAQALAKKVMSGNIQLNAPFPGIDQPWTKEKKSEFQDFLKKFS